MTTIRSSNIRLGALGAAVAFTMTACGGGADDETDGTYVHAEEGTIVLEPDGDGTITQSGEPVPFVWERDGDTIEITIDGEVVAEATADGDELTFRPGDFSGDSAVTFTRS